MLHVLATDNNPKSPTKGERLSIPATILECPPVKLFSVRFYKKTEYGLRVAKEILLTNDNLLKRKLSLPKEYKPKLDNINAEEFDEVRVIVYTQSQLTSRGQKTPELFEMGIGGKPADQLEFVKQNLNKEIGASDVFSEGELVDISAVTKGKGFQGTVKRFGVAIKSHKSEKKKRSVGNLGPWHPAHVLSTVPQPGKMGFHVRSEKNKWILRISDENLNPAGGFKHYGSVKNEYILLKGSVPGPAKRLIRLFKPKRPAFHKEAPLIEKLSLVIAK